MTMTKEEQEHLEGLIDRYGLPEILKELARIAYAKADHVEVNWQDARLAKRWTAIGHRLGTVGQTTTRL